MASSPPQQTAATPSSGKTYDIILALHSFTNVPIADINTLSADPYLILKVKVPTCPHDTPSIRFRTPTYHRNRSPLFDPDCFWRISNIPSTGFSLKIKAYDEDPMNSDDGLGSRKIQFGSLEKDWKKENIEVDLKRLHNGSMRAFGCAGLLRKLGGKGGKEVVQHKGVKSGRPVVCMSIYVVGESEGKGRKGECWTAGPCYFTKHFSPLVGRVTGIVAPPDMSSDEEGKQKEPKYNFQANELQLPGPVPPELNHAFVPSKWLIKAWFKGILLPHVLHNHHRRIFSHDNLTVYGVIVPDSDRKLLPEKLQQKLIEHPRSAVTNDNNEKQNEDSGSKTEKNKQKAEDDEKGRVDEAEARAEIAEERRHIDDQKILEDDEITPDADPQNPSRSAGKKPPFKKATAPLNIAERFLEMCGMIDEGKSVMEKQHHKKRRPQKGRNERKHHCCRKCGQVKESKIKKVINQHGNNRMASSSSKSDSHDGHNKGEESGGGVNKTSAGKQRFIGQGCLFTYVVLLDGKMRWSEVGMGFMKEFGSKHVILANGSKHVAMAGEFLIQNLPNGGFKLVIDNDSGTYRPPKEVLKTFKKFLEGVFGEGLEIEVLHCWGDEGERLSKMKKEHLKGREKAEEEEEEEEEDDEKENEEEEDEGDCDDCKSKGGDGDDEDKNDDGDKEKRDKSDEDGGMSKNKRE